MKRRFRPLKCAGRHPPRSGDARALSVSRLKCATSPAVDSSIAGAIKDSYERMPRQMKVAARWLHDHPTEVALLSMRAQARRAGVPPATLTRLAQRLGFDGFDKLREVFANSIRAWPRSFTGHAEELPAGGGAESDAALIGNRIDGLHGQLKYLACPSAIAALAAAADVMVAAKTIFCLGHRSTFPAAYLIHYAGSLLGPPIVLIEGVGGAPNDALRSIGPGDVFLAVTVSPYTRYTVRAAEFAVSRGARLVALTDSELSPVAMLAEIAIHVRTGAPSPFHTMTPVFAAAECLVDLIAVRQGSRAFEALEANEEYLAAFDTYVLPGSRRPR